MYLFLQYNRCRWSLSCLLAEQMNCYMNVACQLLRQVLPVKWCSNQSQLYTVLFFVVICFNIELEEMRMSGIHVCITYFMVTDIALGYSKYKGCTIPVTFPKITRFSQKSLLEASLISCSFPPPSYSNWDFRKNLTFWQS